MPDEYSTVIGRLDNIEKTCNDLVQTVNMLAQARNEEYSSAESRFSTLENSVTEIADELRELKTDIAAKEANERRTDRLTELNSLKQSLANLQGDNGVSNTPLGSSSQAGKTPITRSAAPYSVNHSNNPLSNVTGNAAFVSKLLIIILSSFGIGVIITTAYILSGLGKVVVNF